MLVKKLTAKLSVNIALACYSNNIFDITIITEAAELTAAGLVQDILLLPGVDGNVTIYNAILLAGQEAYAYAYPYVYYTSIAFGAISIIASCFLGDIGK